MMHGDFMEPTISPYQFDQRNVMHSDIIASAAKAVPPVGASAFLWIAQNEIQPWLAFLTSVGAFVYIAAQIYVLLKKDRREGRKP